MNRTDRTPWGAGDTPFARSLLKLLLLFVLLKCAVAVYVWLPAYNLPNFYRATPEFFFVFLLLGLTARLNRSSALFVLSGMLCCALFVLSLGEGVTQYLYRRSLNPVVDFSFFPEFIRLLFESKQGLSIVLYAAAFIAVMGLIFTGIFYLLRWIVISLRGSRYPGRVFTLLLVMFLAAWLIPSQTSGPGDSLVVRIVRSVSGREEIASTGVPVEIPEEDGDGGTVAARRRRSVLLFIIESYG